MNLDLTDTQHASRFMRDLWRDQLPFATSKEINRTALDFQGTQRHRMVSIFNVRRPTFVLRAVKIKPFSTKRLLRARVLIDPPGGRKRADILTKFESDTQKTPFSGSRIAIPTDNVPRTPAGVIRKRWRPKALNLRGHGSGSRALPGKGHMVLVGDRKTVAFLKPGGRGGIFERDGPDLVPLYWFAPRVRIRPNLRFVHTARRTIRQRWERNFTRAFNESVRTARVRGPSFAGIGRLAGAVGRVA